MNRRNVLLPVDTRVDFPRQRRRQHHLAFTVYAILLIVLSSFVALVNFLPSLVDRIQTAYLQDYPQHPRWYLPLIATCEALNVACLVMMLRWRRWAVYVFALASLTICAAATFTGDVTLAGSRAVMLLLLIFFLWLGSPRSTWSQLS